jgi:heat shock protein HtpX
MYSAIDSNKRKSWLLLGASILLVAGVGWLLDQYFGGNGGIVVIAVIYSLISALVTYYSGDKIALWTSGAKLIEKKDAEELYRLVENLCIAGGQPLPKIYVINDPAPNAFATGRDPEHASIAFTTGLLERLDRTELEGVTAHELSHVKNYDIRIMTIVAVLVGTITIMVDLFFRARWHGGSDRDRRAGMALLIVFILAIVLALVAANLIKLAVSRKREYLADASGALLTRYPEGLARALEKISSYAEPMHKAHSSTAHLFISNPFGSKASGFLAGLFSTHPPIAERIKILREMGTNPNA